MQLFFPSVHQIMPKIIQKTYKALSMQEKKKSVIPNSYAYLLTSHCNLISIEELKSPQITITENTGILLCSLNTSVYTK